MWFPKRWLTNDKGLARDLNHVIFWNHVVVTCVPFICIGWPQMTWFLNYRFLVAFRNLIFRIWSIFAKSYFIPGAIFGKNVEKIIKSHVPETGIRPKDEEKHETDANSCWFSNVTIVPFHSVHSLAGSREVTWTTSDLISRDWRRIQFWKCSIFAFLRKIVKDEIEKLQNWIKFITKRFDPF